MNRKKILIILLMIIILCPQKIYGYQQVAIGDYNLFSNEPLETIQKKIEDVSSAYYAYNDNMYATVKMKVSKKKDNSGNTIYVLGTGANTINWEYGLPESIFDSSDKKEGSSWDVWLDIQYTLYEGNGENNYNALVANSFLDDTGDFNPEEDGWKGQKKIDKVIKKTVGTFADTIDTALLVKDFIADFVADAIGTGISFIMNILGKFGDGIQWLANTIQTTESNQVLYSFETLSDSSNVDADNKNQYTNVKENQEDNEEMENQIVVNLKSDENENGTADYTKDTEIPVMTGDIYNVAVGHLDFFDINFLTGANDKRADGTRKHKYNSSWMVIRNFVSLLIHITIYFASAFLIISLIWFGIQTTRHSFDDPKTVADYKKGLERFEKGFAMLIGTIMIMALCIFGTEAFYSQIEINETYELPIRVKVEDVYSFSTTPAGYVRYLSLTEDVRDVLKKITCTMTYIILATVNLAVVIIMFLRMFVLWGLAIGGPVVVVLYVLGVESPLKFKTWVSLFIRASLIQIFIAIAYMIFLKMVV